MPFLRKLKSFEILKKNGEKWGNFPILKWFPHKILSPFFPIFPHFSPLPPPLPSRNLIALSPGLAGHILHSESQQPYHLMLLELEKAGGLQALVDVYTWSAAVPKQGTAFYRFLPLFTLYLPDL